MKNRKLLLIVSLVLALTMSLGGTLAYLTDTDADVNVMTLGNVKIAQHEYQRATSEDGSYKTDTIDDQNSYVLEDFEQNKPLLPYVGDPANENWDDTTVRMTQVGSYGGMNVFIGKNAVDKFVTVENTGNTDAYVRTLVAIEYGTGDLSLIGRSHHLTWEENMVGEIEIDGNNYYLYEYVYLGADDVRHDNGILPAGDTSYPNLAQVYLKSEATNEDCEALDGNGNGTLDIIVLSQAVQAAGFDSADTALNTGFGEVNAANAATWFGGTVIPSYVSTADELKDALAAGGSVMLAKDIVVTEQLYVNSDVTVNLDTNGYSLTREETNGYVIRNNGGTLTVDGDGSIGSDFGAISTFGGKTVINSGNFYANGVQGQTHHVVFANSGAELIINGGTFSHNGGGISDSGAVVTFMGNSTVTINGGTFASNANYIEEIANWGGTLTDNR